jgi:hypothetical protein
VYGDDSLGSVHDRVKEWYNMRTIQMAFKLFGMIYTDPGKKEEVPMFLDVLDASFLGRGFVKSTNVVLAPLNLEAIYGMLHWVRTETLTVDEALDNNIRCALMEMYHHGREAFEKLKLRLYVDGAARGYVSRALTDQLYTYEFFRKWHINNYHNCSDREHNVDPEFHTIAFFQEQ